MKIVIIGSGKVGITLADQLAKEGHQVTVLDRKEEHMERLAAKDLLIMEGDGLHINAQKEAGVPEADLVIATMATDEQNLTACMIAKKLGAENTVARIRNPDYIASVHLLKDDINLRMMLNPERACASEIARLLRTPSSIKIDTFSKGRVELHKTELTPKSPLVGKSLMDLGKLQQGVLVCAVERGEDQVYIPDGSFCLQAGDRISFVAEPATAVKFLNKIGIPTNPVKEVMLIGGGMISYYLAEQLIALGVRVKIIERNAETCEYLSQHLPKATIIEGDGTSEQLLLQEGLSYMDAVAALTGEDEENILISLFAKTASKAKRVTKISRFGFSQVISAMDLGSVFYPRYIASDITVRFARALQNSVGSNVETLYKLIGGKVEALEFRATETSAVCGKPLMTLKLQPNLLIGAINRNGHIMTPGGKDTIEPGDMVVVVTTITGLNDLDDILDKRRAKP